MDFNINGWYVLSFVSQKSYAQEMYCLKTHADYGICIRMELVDRHCYVWYDGTIVYGRSAFVRYRYKDDFLAMSVWGATIVILSLDGGSGTCND